jgi:Txe/YoeB family toxin of toxin-antitoxin system
MYEVKFTKQAAKDYDLLENAGLYKKRDQLIEMVEKNPYQNPPPYEIMKHDYKGAISRRINRKHRFVYEILPNTDNLKDEAGVPFIGVIKIITMWTHYERL